MEEFEAQLDRFSALDQLVVPDLWQQEAVQHLRAGKDVVVHAATGAGKTFIFELWSNEGRNPGQAIYTVPTRALANDKLAEWRRLKQVGPGRDPQLAGDFVDGRGQRYLSESAAISFSAC